MNRAQLINDVLQDLFVLDAATNTAAPEDVAVCSTRIDAAIEYLKGANVCYIADADSVEDRFYEPLVRYLVQVLAPKFGRPRNTAEETDAKMSLRRLDRLGRGTGATLRVDPGIRPRRFGQSLTLAGFMNGDV